MTRVVCRSSLWECIVLVRGKRGGRKSFEEKV